ncbi:2-amino-4-hydroxy-6-hydroxymethyldihydropteridinediphosphokinase [soil metagenome]
MIRVFLLLGSNEGNRKGYLEKARFEIGLQGGLCFITSSIYQTAAWGKEDQAAFLNQVIGIETELRAEDLLKTLLNIEAKIGRTRTEKWGSRIIDIDILFYGNKIIKTGDLVVPHPRIQERRFTLVPLSDVAPDLIHPVLQKNVSQLLEECSDELEVRLFR